MTNTADIQVPKGIVRYGPPPARNRGRTTIDTASIIAALKQVPEMVGDIKTDGWAVIATGVSAGAKTGKLGKALKELNVELTLAKTEDGKHELYARLNSMDEDGEPDDGADDPEADPAEVETADPEVETATARSTAPSRRTADRVAA